MGRRGPALARCGLADGRVREKRHGPRDPLLPILHDSFDPGVDRSGTPFKALADLDIDIRDLACSFQDMAVLNFEEVFECAQELLGLENEVKDLHHRNEHCSWLEIP
jgi:hypothetical protein